MKRIGLILILLVLLLGTALNATAAPQLSLGSATVGPGGSTSLNLSLSGGAANAYAGVNAKIILPAGITIPAVGGVSEGPLLSSGDFTIAYNAAGSNVTVIAYSDTDTFSARSGVLLTLTVQASGSLSTGDYDISFADSNANRVNSKYALSTKYDLSNGDGGTISVVVQPVNSSITVADTSNTDGDDLPDTWEQQIIDADSNDNIAAFSHVKENDDFDGDGENNLTEYNNGTDPTDAMSTNNSSNAYMDFHFEIFRGAEQITGFTTNSWGAELICWPKEGASFKSGTLTKPDGTTGIQTVDLDITKSGDEAEFFEYNFTSLSDLMADFAAGDYHVDLVVKPRGSSAYHLRFTISVPAYNANAFPAYEVIQGPLPKAEDVSVTPLLDFTTQSWDFLFIEMADTGNEDYFYINDLSNGSHQLPASEALQPGITYKLVVDTNEWDSTWLGCRTSLQFTTDGSSITPTPVLVKKVTAIGGNKVGTLDLILSVLIQGNANDYQAWENGYPQPVSWETLPSPEGEGLYHIPVEIDPVDPTDKFFGTKRTINVCVANYLYESKPKSTKVTLAVPKVSGVKVNGTNKAGVNDVPIMFKITGEATYFEISADPEFKEILVTEDIDALDITDKGLYMLPSFDLSTVAVDSKGKKTVYIRLGNDVGESKAQKAVVKLIVPKVSAFKVNGNNKAALNGVVPVTFKVKGNAERYYISTDATMENILSSGQVSGLSMSDKGIYTVPSFNLSGVSAVVKGKGITKTVYLMVDNEVGDSKVLKAKVKIID